MAGEPGPPAKPEAEGGGAGDHSPALRHPPAHPYHRALRHRQNLHRRESDRDAAPGNFLLMVFGKTLCEKYIYYVVLSRYFLGSYYEKPEVMLLCYSFYSNVILMIFSCFPVQKTNKG